MKIKMVIVALLSVFAAGITFTIIIISNKNMTEVDLVAINDVVKTAEKNWGQITEDTLRNLDINQPFSIIDQMENVIYQTEGNHFNNLYEAIKNRDTIMDMKQNNEMVGKLIIHNNEQNLLQGW